MAPSSTSPPDDNKETITYASAGVSISNGNEMVDQIRPLVASTAQPWAPAIIGGFGGVIDLSLAGHHPESPLAVFGTDGVGTKVKIALAMNKHDTIGIDLVAMNVNDIVVQGARPLAFLDCFSCNKLNVEVAVEFVKGVCEGCRQAGCALVGGETAEMPGTFADEANGYDPTGTAFGTIEAGRRPLPDKEAMKVGDVLIGLASSGCHSNGYSLTRKIVEQAGLSYDDPAPWEHESEAEGIAKDSTNSTSISPNPSITVGHSLLTPTRIYVRPLLHILNSPQGNLIKGLAHITGGGLPENIPRILPPHLSAELDARSWPVPPVMRWLKRNGSLPDREFARVLNAGLGMVVVVDGNDEKDVDDILRELAQMGEKAFVIGKLVERAGEGEGCIIKNTEQNWR